MKSITLIINKKVFDFIKQNNIGTIKLKVSDYWIKRLFVNYREFFQLEKNKVLNYLYYDFFILKNYYNKKLEILECKFINIVIENNYFIIKLQKR